MRVQTGWAATLHFLSCQLGHVSIPAAPEVAFDDTPQSKLSADVGENLKCEAIRLDVQSIGLKPGQGDLAGNLTASPSRHQTLFNLG